jgi:hypothetical protein
MPDNVITSVVNTPSAEIASKTFVAATYAPISEPLSLHLDQTTPQTIFNGAENTLKFDAAQLTISQPTDTYPYFGVSVSSNNPSADLFYGLTTAGSVAYPATTQLYSTADDSYAPYTSGVFTTDPRGLAFSATAGKVMFQAAGATRMTIETTGYVGIGVLLPACLLDVTSTTSPAAQGILTTQVANQDGSQQTSEIWDYNDSGYGSWGAFTMYGGNGSGDTYRAGEINFKNRNLGGDQKVFSLICEPLTGNSGKLAFYTPFSKIMTVCPGYVAFGTADTDDGSGSVLQSKGDASITYTNDADRVRLRLNNESYTNQSASILWKGNLTGDYDEDNIWELGTDYDMNQGGDFFLYDHVNSAKKILINNSGQIAFNGYCLFGSDNFSTYLSDTNWPIHFVRTSDWGSGSTQYIARFSTTSSTQGQMWVSNSDGSRGFQLGFSSTDEAVTIQNSANNATGNCKILDGQGGYGFLWAQDYRAEAAGAYYFGADTSDGSWRITRSGNNLVIQRRESGNWVTKSTISA